MNKCQFSLQFQSYRITYKSVMENKKAKFHLKFLSFIKNDRVSRLSMKLGKNEVLGGIEGYNQLALFIGQISKFMLDFRIKMHCLALLQMINLAAQGKLQLSFAYDDEFLSRVFVFNHFVIFPGLDGNPERAKVLVRRARGKRLVGIVLSALGIYFLPLSVNLDLFLVGQKAARIDL